MQETPLDPIDVYNPNIPEAFSTWLQKMIAIDPAERFQSYQEATEYLPEPIQSAPVPVSSVAVQNQPATAQTSTHAVPTHTTATQTTSAAADFAARQQQKDKSKNPMIFGGIGAVVVIILAIVILSGGDEETATDTASSTTTNETNEVEAVEDIPQKGIVAFFDFNRRSLYNARGTKLKIERLADRASYSNNGLSGKALVLDKNHFFRIPLAGSSISKKSDSFTLSFWIKSGSSSQNDLAVVSDEPWYEGDSEPFKDDDSLWQWNPSRNASLDSSDWNMVTMIYSKGTQSVDLYLNGESLGSSSTDAIDSKRLGRYIFIGCDSDGNFSHQTPMVIDDLAIWDRPLSRKEIMAMYDASHS